MKKSLLFISTLFAAGTLGASAAINLGDSFVDTTATSISSAVVIGGSGQGTDKTSGLGLYDIVRASIFTSQVSTTLSGLNISDGKTFSLTDGTLYGTSGKGASSVENFVSVSSGTISLGNQSGQLGSIAYVQNSISQEAIDTASSLKKALSLDFTVSGLKSDGIANLSVTILQGVAGTDSVTWTVVGSSRISSNGAQTIDFGSNATISATDEIVIVFGTGNIAAGSTNNSTDTGDGIIGAHAQASSGLKISNIVLAIPEPSLFGLFAGTLALGLAGTRRRRGNAKNQ